MGKLLDGVKELHTKGTTQEPEVYFAIARSIDSFFRYIRRQRNNYYQSFAYNDEETFILFFEEEFQKNKLDIHGLSLLASQTDDSKVESTLYFLVSQFYNTMFIEESNKHAGYTLDKIIDTLKKKGLIEVYDSELNRKSRTVSMKKQIDMEECEKYFTKNFLNVDAKVLSLQIVLNELQRKERVRYYDLLNEITQFFGSLDSTTGSLDINFDDDADVDNEVDYILQSPVYSSAGSTGEDDTNLEQKDQNEDISSNELENLWISHSDQLDNEPITLDQIICPVKEMAQIKELLKSDEDEITEDTGILVNLLCKRLKTDEFNSFFLTLLYGGISEKPVPLEIRNKITGIMAISMASYYNYMNGFSSVVKKIRTDDRYGFDDSDVIAAIDHLLKVFKRNFVL